MAKRKILVVDDVPDYTRLVKLTLEATGDYDVLVESDPRVATRVAREFQPDVILLDVIMPGVDGTDIAQELREDPQLSTMPIVFLTASVEPEIVAGVPTFQGMPCLAKPAAIDDILDAIDRVLVA